MRLTLLVVVLEVLAARERRCRGDGVALVPLVVLSNTGFDGEDVRLAILVWLVLDGGLGWVERVIHFCSFSLHTFVHAEQLLLVLLGGNFEESYAADGGHDGVRG